MKKKKIIFMVYVFMGMAIIFGLSGVKANAAVTYSDTNTIYGKRTQAEIAKKYSEGKNAGETYKNGDRSTYYSQMASTTNPYNPGVLTTDTLKAMQGMTDFYRWLLGMNPLQDDCKQDTSLQYQALDRNFEFNHYISNANKPQDMSDELWQKGYACEHNILARGYTPQGAITGWINEGYNLNNKSWNTLGHRYALINPRVAEIQFGYCGNIAIGKNVTSVNATYKEAFSAFPSAGYMPNVLVSPKECAWAVDFNTSILKIVTGSNVLVTVTNQTSKESYTCKSEDNTAQVSAGRISFVQPSDYTGYRYTDTYTVKITGLTDTVTGQDATLTYNVRFFDVSELEDSYVKSAEPDGFNHLVIYKSLNDTENLRKIAAVLSDKIMVIAESGKIVEMPVKGDWILDEKNQCYINSVDAAGLPGNIKDKNSVLKEVKVTYEISDDYYDAYNSLRFSSTSPKEHDVGRITVYRTNVSYERSKVFKINKTENGNYSGTLRYDSSTSVAYDKEESTGPYSYYHIDSFQVSDSGEYVSIYYSDNSYWDEAYVSTSIQKLTVTHDYNSVVTAVTCTEDGYTTHKCSICGDEYVDNYKEKLGHNYIENVKTPTCTEDGYTAHKCSNCGDEYKDDYEDKLGHIFEYDGAIQKVCQVCGTRNPDFVRESITQDPTTQAPTTQKPTEGEQSTTNTVETYASVKNVNAAILNQKNDKDPKDSKFGLLQAKAKKIKKTSQKIAWKKVNGAAGYIIYGNACGKSYKKLKNTTQTNFTQKKLKKGKYYKYLIVAYNAKGEVITISKTIHSATKGGKYCNYKSVKLKKTEATLSVGKTYKIKVKQVKESKKKKVKKHRGVSYESSNSSVATVSAKGVVKGLGKGTCIIYLYAQNGAYKAMKVTVK